MKKNSCVVLVLFLLLAVNLLAQQPIQIVCVGNSITEGFSNSSQAKAWPAVLNKLLGSEYAVYNCAVSGTTMFRNSNYPYWSTPKYANAKELNPQILIIALGTNDADPWRWNTLKGEFKTDYLALIQEFRANGRNPIIYVCLPPPLFGEAKAPQNKVVENELIPIIKEISRIENTYLIDFHTPLVAANHLFPDNVHPNDAGAEQMAKIAYQKVKEGQTVPEGFVTTKRVSTVKDIHCGGSYTAIYTQPNGQRSVRNFLAVVKGAPATPLTARSQVKENAWTDAVSVVVNPGGVVAFDPQPKEEGGFWTWIGPKGFFSNGRTLYIRNIRIDQAGKYTATYTNQSGIQSRISFTVAVAGEMECPTLKPFINVNNKWEETTTVAVKTGESVTFGPHPSDGKWSWMGPDNFSATEREASVAHFNASKAGQYVGVFTNDVGCRVSIVFTLTLKQ